MAACGSLQHIFDNPIPENPSSLIESLSSSWKQIKPLKPPVDHSFTEIFGELHFKENLNPHPAVSSSSLSSFPVESITRVNSSGQQDDKWNPVSPFSSNGNQGSYHKKSESFSSMKSESLQLCTEGLGFESLDNIEDSKIEFKETCENHNEKNSNSNNNDNDNMNFNYNSNYTMREKFYVRGHSNHHQYYSKGKTNRRAFPPPISCIGRTGKPWVCFQSFRQDGRFVLNEIRIPTQEFLHACREDGRLRLCFVQPSEQGDDAAVEEGDAVEDEGVGEEQEDHVKEEERVEMEEEADIRDDFERGNS